MPGLYHLVTNNGKNNGNSGIESILHSHPDIKFQSIRTNDLSELLVFSNQNYPSQTWSYKGFSLIMLGLIYNQSFNNIKSDIEVIIDNFSNDANYIERIKEFVNSSDGDFIIYGYSEETNKGLLFNDFLGRLPLYYYSDGSSIIYCSELKGVIHNIPKIDINIFEAVNYLMFEHTLGVNTMFKDVRRLLAGKVLSFDNNLRIHEEESEFISFEKNKTKKSKRQTL